MSIEPLAHDRDCLWRDALARFGYDISDAESLIDEWSASVGIRAADGLVEGLSVKVRAPAHARASPERGRGAAPHRGHRRARRGRLEYEARSAHGKRVRRSVLEAYRQTFAPPTRRPAIDETLREFSLATDLSPAEFERRWLAREIDDTDENARLWGMARVLNRWLAKERSKRAKAGAVAVTGSPGARG